MLEKCVKEHVFPKIKFATLNGDLDFSNNPNSICRFMAEKMKVAEENVEAWWENSKKAVNNKLKANRNNVIKAIKTRFHGKEACVLDFVMLLLCHALSKQNSWFVILSMLSASRATRRW